jgi:hypothetical protein
VALIKDAFAFCVLVFVFASHWLIEFEEKRDMATNKDWRLKTASAQRANKMALVCLRTSFFAVFLFKAEVEGLVKPRATKKSEVSSV